MFMGRYPIASRMFLMDADGGAGNGGAGTGAETYSKEYVQDLRREAADYRTKLRTAEEDRDKYKKQFDEGETKTNTLLGRVKEILKLDAVVGLDELSTKLETAIKSADNMSEKAKSALLKSAFNDAATKANLVDADAAFKLADLTTVNVDLESLTVYPVDKDGKQIQKDGKAVLGLSGIVETLVKDKPYLAGKAGSSSVGSGSNPGTGDPPDAVATAKAMAEARNKGPAAAEGSFDPWAPKG
jgi:hypothetical protein